MKSYMHARDVGLAVQLIAEKALPGNIYNCGPDDATSIRDLVELVAKELNIPFEQLVQIAPDRAGEDAIYWLNSDKIKRELGWRITIPLDEGIREMVAWGRRYIKEISGEQTDFVLRA